MCWEFDGAGFPEKRLKILIRNRTGIRHRWVGREDQGERVKDPQGTRQKSIRKFAIWIDARKRACNKSTPGDCLTKTQLPANS